MSPAGSGNSQQGHQPNRQSWDPNAQQYHHPDDSYPQQQTQHPNGAYPHRPDQQLPPPPAPSSSARPDRPEMAAIHQNHHPYPYPHQHAAYQLPAPQNFYQHPPHQDYRTSPHQPQPQQQPGQSAPRQRTAIACKYCRRRKIRCSGFENSEDGRCSNCIRFSQECVFTPVSAQTQAFVPAQALYGRGRGGPPPGQPQQLYGPYGNRLPPHHDPYAQPPPPPPGHHPAYTLPSPTAAYPPPPPGQPYGYPPQPGPSYEQQPPPPPPPGARRRRDDEPHVATAPPPNPGPHAALADHRTSHGGPPPGYAYPDPQYGHPAPGAYQPHPQQPYYGSEQPRRPSPSSAYSYDPSRHSQSPNAPPYGYPPAAAPGQPQYAPAPGQASSATSSRTPPPAAERGRSGMSIHDMVGGSDGASSGSGERSHADNDMVSKLNRPSQR